MSVTRGHGSSHESTLSTSGPDLRSATREDRPSRTGLEKRSDADTGVLGREDGDERFLLEFQTRIERGFESGIDDLFRESLGGNRPGGEFRRKCKGPTEHIGRRMDLVDESDRKRLLGPHLTPGQDQVLGARRPDKTGESLRAPTSRDDPEEDLRLTELRVVGRDAQIARKSQFASATEGGSVHCGDDDRRNGGHGTESLEKESPYAQRFIRATELGDLRSGGEDPVATGNDHCAGRRLGQILRNLLQGDKHPRRKRIDFAVAQSHKCNAIFTTFESHEFVGHVADPTVRHSPGWASKCRGPVQRTRACASITRVATVDDRDNVPNVPDSPPEDHQSIAQYKVPVIRTDPNGSPTVVLS